MSNAIMSALFGAQYDYPRMEGGPRVQLMIASVPRSGSTAFCNDLWNTGVLGAPMEYLNLRWIEQNGRWAQELATLEGYWREVQAVRTSPNGVFAYKMFVPNYFTLLQRCPALLAALTPTHVVYFTREDTLAQAVSYARAIKSQQWFRNGHEADHEYDRGAIENAVAKITAQKSQWEYIFALTDAQSVLRVTYEDYLRDQEEVIENVLRFVCGSSAGRVNLGIPNIDVQRDISSYQWIEQYRNGSESIEVA